MQRVSKKLEAAVDTDGCVPSAVGPEKGPAGPNKKASRGTGKPKPPKSSLEFCKKR